MTRGHQPISTALPSGWANRPRRGRRLIGLTPLIDVVFILLVFFMLAAHLLEWRTIRLNATASAGLEAGLEGALMVEIRTDSLRLSGEPVSPEGLARRLSTHLARTPDRRVLVSPGPDVTLQEAIAVLDRIVGIGAENLAFVRGADG